MKIQDTRKYRAYVDKTGDSLKIALRKALEFIRWEEYIGKGSVVFVKPNFTFPYYREGITTSPELLRYLLELIKSKTDNVIVGESDGGNRSFKAEEAFRNHGMCEICKETGVELVNLSTLPSEIIESKIGAKAVRIELPKMLLEEIDCLISVPVLKVHAMTGVSLSIKNLWGCVPDTMRCLQHQNLAYKLALITKLLMPRIVVMDGLNALNRHGPMYGDPVKMDLILASDNPVVADALGAMVMGFSPQKTKHIVVAEKAGLGSLNIEHAEINQDWKQYRRQFQLERTFLDKASTLLFHSDALAKLVMDSPLTSVIYKLAGLLRSSDEKEVAKQMGKHKTLGSY